jgi:hypothetical protein
VGDLPKDLASATVIRHIVVDLNPAVDRTRVHHDAGSRQVRCALPGQSILDPIIRSDTTPGCSFKLHPKHHDHVKIP